MARREYSPDFETAWSSRPQRPNESKVDAWRAWCSAQRAGALPSLDRYLAAQAAYAGYLAKKKTEPEFIQHMATFINKRSFEYWLGQIDKMSQNDSCGKPAESKENSEIPAIMAPVFKALGDERYLQQFSSCQFEDRDGVLVIRSPYRFMLDRIQDGLVSRLTGRRVLVEVAA